jgi:hypothetical protein
MYNCKSIFKGKTNQLKINLYLSLFENEYAKKYLQWANEYSTDILQIEKTVDTLRETNYERYKTKKQQYYRILNDLVEIQEFLITRALQIETKST